MKKKIIKVSKILLTLLLVISTFTFAKSMKQDNTLFETQSDGGLIWTIETR